MKPIIFTILLISFVTAVEAQRADSLLHVLKTVRDDSLKVETYLALYYEYYRSDQQQALRYTIEAEQLAEKAELESLLGRAKFRKVSVLIDLRRYDEAKDIAVEAMAIFTKLGDTTRIVSLKIEQANALKNQGKPDEALVLFIDALTFVERQGDKNGEARIRNYLGTIFLDQKQYNKAIEHYERALELVRELDFKLGISACLTNLGNLYIKIKKYDLATASLIEALALKKLLRDDLGAGKVLNGLANIKVAQQQFDAADSLYQQAYDFFVKVGNVQSTVMAAYGLAESAFKGGNYQKSITRAIALLELDGDHETVMQTHRLLARNYEKQKQFRLALEHINIFVVLYDSLYNEKMAVLTTEIETKYKTEKSAQEIELLKSKNEVQSLHIENRERERYYLIALAVIIFILVVVLYNRYTLKTKAHAKLKELDKIKSTFFANISHEFRTPLTLISGSLEDLSGNVSNNEDQARLAIMQKNTKRLRQLIEQLLDLSRLESGRLKLNVTPIDSNNFLNAITSSFSSWATQKNILLSVDLPEEGIVIYADEDVLEKIINNLLSNAIKFTPQHGTVSFSAHWNSEELKIQVSDDGPGIPESQVNQIFERFYQMDDSSTRKHEGSGIGLALVKELVSLHHGQISVKSHPNEGAIFNCVIPIHKKYYTSSETSTSQNNKLKIPTPEIAFTVEQEYPEYTEPTGNNPIILVVEDNVDLGHYIADHLPNHTIILAYNGVDGFQKATHHIPDLIISDVMMPEMDGVEFCKKIKEEETTSHIPVILLTAKADIESRLEGLETGADDYMTKPFDARELQTRVKNLIQQREKLRERFSRTVILKPKDIALTSPDEVFLEKVMAIIEDHLGDSEYTAEDFQKEIGMSRMQLYRKLKALTGHSANDFIRIQRLIRASELLANGQGNISEVCYQTGFSSLSYFDRCFKKQFEVTPKEYILSHSKSE